MSRNDQVHASELAEAALHIQRLLYRVGLRRSPPGISISRWPRPRRQRAMAAGLGLAIGSGIGTTTGLLMFGADRPESAVIGEAFRACGASPSCLEWRVLAHCQAPALIGPPRTKARTIHAFGRTPDEAAWVVAASRADCVVEKVTLVGENSPHVGARAQ